jgi:NAD(P) transhydrogenase
MSDGFTYDIAIIGAGPAGEKAATRAAYLGRSVALVEREVRFGGTCGKGALASKILRESALIYRGAARRLADVLQPVERRAIEMPALLRAVDQVCDAHYQGVREAISKHAITWVHGSARFVDPHTLAVAGPDGVRQLTASVIVIATGSRPSQPSFVPWGAPGVFHADTILSMTTIPRRLVVVGGGVIGMEFASIFAALDVDVCVIEQRPRLLSFLDEDLAAHLRDELGRRGARIHLGQTVTACDVRDDGDIDVTTDAGSQVRADAVLFSGGRLANTDDLDLEKIGLVPERQGRLAVDRFFRTAVPHVYAVGDVVGFPALASTSMEQGRTAVGHALRDQLADRPDVLPFDDSLPYALLPYGLYTIPSVATIGATEDQLRSEGRPYVAGVASYAGQARGHLIGDTSGRLKLLACPATRRVLGVHIVGETAEELIHVGQACMHYEGTIDYFLRTVFNFPTLAGLYKSASYAILQQLR